MQKTTVIGIAAGFICVIITILLGGTLGAFAHLPSVFVVIGGTLAATVISYPANTLKTAMGSLKIAFKAQEIDYNDQIELIVQFANIARREGLLALESELEDIDDPFLKKGIMLIADGADAELTKSILQTEIYFLQERHGANQAVMSSMAGYAPAFGMVGTLIGLINMLKNLDDPDSLGPGMSTALITTFYGTILANLVFSPLAKKLKSMTDKEVLQKEMVMEGILSIQDGENPRIIKDKLMSFVSQSDIPSEDEQSDTVNA